MKRIAWVLLAAACLAGCEWFEDPSPNEARLVIGGDTGKQVRLIISTVFVATVNEQGQTRVVMIESDTVFTSLPYEQRYNIEEDQRFFVEAARVETDPHQIRVQVFIDNRRECDVAGLLVQGDPFRFVYAFNQGVTQEILVL
jgi:hypothetical protein